MQGIRSSNFAYRFSRKSSSSSSKLTGRFTESPASEQVDTLYDRCEDYKTYTSDLVGRFRKEWRSSQSYVEETKRASDGLISFYDKISQHDADSVLLDCFEKTRDFQLNYATFFADFAASMHRSVSDVLSRNTTGLFAAAKTSRKNFLKAKAAYETALLKKGKDTEAEVDVAKEAYFAAGEETLVVLKDTVKEVELQILNWMCSYWDTHYDFHTKSAKWVGNVKSEVDKYRDHSTDGLAKQALEKASRSKATGNSFKDAANTKVFGCPLEELIKREDGDVPAIVDQMIARLMVTAPTLEGVFRISAMKSALVEIQERIDKGQPVDFADVSDAHIVPALLKQFLRDLPEPLLPFEMYPAFIRANDIDDETVRVGKLKDLVKKLPVANRALFKRLLAVLSKITEYEDVTKMGPTNLSTVIGPNILYDRQINPATMVEDMENANSIVVTCISKYQDLFRIESPLEAVREGDLNSLKRVQQEGKDMTEVDEKGRNALHVACAKSNLDITEYLVGLEPLPLDVNAQDKEGHTALMLLCQVGDDRASLLAQYLLNAGADVDTIKDKKGKSALDIAAASSSELQEILVDFKESAKAAPEPTEEAAVPEKEETPAEPEPEAAAPVEEKPAEPKEAPKAPEPKPEPEKPKTPEPEPEPEPEPAPAPVKVEKAPPKPRETPEEIAARAKARAAAMLKSKTEARGGDTSGMDEHVEGLVYERVRSLQSLITEEVPLQSVYSLVNVNEMTLSVCSLVKAGLPATFGAPEIAALNGALKASADSLKNLFVVVKKFASLFGDEDKKDVLSNALAMQGIIKSLIPVVKGLNIKPTDSGLRDDLTSSTKQMIDCVYKFFRACQVASSEYVVNTSQTCAEHITKILEAGNGDMKDDLDAACNTAAFSVLKLSQLIKCKAAQRARRDKRCPLDASASIIERSTLELINEARRLWSQGAKPNEETNTMAKKILLEFRQLGTALNKETSETMLSLAEQADQFNAMADVTSQIVQELSEVTFSSDLDKALVLQMKQIARKLETFANFDSLEDRVVISVTLEITEALKKIRVGLGAMEKKSRDSSLNRRMRVWSEALLNYILVVRLSVSATLMKLPIEAEMQLFVKLDGMIVQCSEFYKFLGEIRS